MIVSRYASCTSATSTSKKTRLNLHEAYVAGDLTDNLKSTVGKLLVRRELLRKAYPLPWKEFLLAGMVTVSPVVVCTQATMEAGIKGPEIGQGNVIVVPDAKDKSMKTLMHDRSAFLGQGPETADLSWSRWSEYV